MKREGLLRHLRRHGCVLPREGKEHTFGRTPRRSLRSHPSPHRNRQAPRDEDLSQTIDPGPAWLDDLNTAPRALSARVGGMGISRRNTDRPLYEWPTILPEGFKTTTSASSAFSIKFGQSTVDQRLLNQSGPIRSCYASGEE